MTIDQLVAMAKRIHDVEGYHLGSASTREYRNAYWARVMGCAYHGHPAYNATPDPQWHLKNAGGGRPQTDDVATSMPSRSYWDCIAGVGADGYYFTVSGHHEPLSSEQQVYAPPVPSGGPANPTPPTPVPPTPQPPPGLTAEQVQAMIDASLANVVKYDDPVGLQAATGQQKVLCHENGGPSQDHKPYKLTSRSSVGAWESWKVRRGVEG